MIVLPILFYAVVAVCIVVMMVWAATPPSGPRQ